MIGGRFRILSMCITPGSPVATGEKNVSGVAQQKIVVGSNSMLIQAAKNMV